MALGAAFTCVGAILGSWLGYRARNNTTPNPFSGLKAMIQVILPRRKTKAPGKGPLYKRVKA